MFVSVSVQGWELNRCVCVCVGKSICFQSLQEQTDGSFTKVQYIGI